MPENPVILFDGVCNFCNGMVNFLIRQDRKGILRFAALQSSSGQRLLGQYGLPLQSFNSFVLIEGGKVYTSSTAGLRLYKHLPWYWQWTQLFWIIPPFLRNAVYDLIARNRYRWFGRKEQCLVPTAEVRERFLVDGW